MMGLKKTNTNNQKQPLGVMAYEHICRKIVTLEYTPGQVLDEKELMADLHMGRTPVREALLRLAGEGWAESQPNRGTIVPPITLQDTKAIFEAVRVLEVGIAELVVTQNTSSMLSRMAEINAKLKVARDSGDILGLVETNHDFHLCFARCSKNTYLIRALNEVRNQAKRLSYLSYANEIEPEMSLQAHYASVVTEHDKIMGYLKERNEAKLKETIIQHINTFQERIMRYMAS